LLPGSLRAGAADSSYYQLRAGAADSSYYQLRAGAADSSSYQLRAGAADSSYYQLRAAAGHLFVNFLLPGSLNHPKLSQNLSKMEPKSINN
jgi:hypothetical protein